MPYVWCPELLFRECFRNYSWVKFFIHYYFILFVSKVLVVLFFSWTDKLVFTWFFVFPRNPCFIWNIVISLCVRSYAICFRYSFICKTVVYGLTISIYLNRRDRFVPIISFQSMSLINTLQFTVSIANKQSKFTRIVHLKLWWSQFINPRFPR